MPVHDGKADHDCENAGEHGDQAENHAKSKCKEYKIKRDTRGGKRWMLYVLERKLFGRKEDQADQHDRADGDQEGKEHDFHKV